MSQRRKFIKQSVLSAAFFVPGLQAIAMPKRNLIVQDKPVLLSNWNHGLPANAAEMKKLEAVKRLIAKNRVIKDIQAGFLAMNKDREIGAYAVHPGFNYAQATRKENVLLDSKSKF